VDVEQDTLQQPPPTERMPTPREILLRGRWRVVERFARDGRQYAVVVREERVTEGRALSVREAEVLGRAMAGQSYKVISYELGLAWSTVRVLMHRVRRKGRAPAGKCPQGGAP